LLITIGSSSAIPTGVWHRMQKSPSVPLFKAISALDIALNTGLN
jgi:hypothetical protein